MLYPQLSVFARRIASLFSSSGRAPSRRSYPAAAQRAAIESLESRTLFSAAINVVGNSVSLTDGSTVIADNNFTDFGYVGIKFGSVSRTFTIQNTGDAQLILSSIKSSNKSFIITANPQFTVNANGSTTFTVTFDPKAAGNQKSVVTIKTNDPANDTFTFTIGGQGLNTIINPQNGLQTFVKEQGTGTLRSSSGMHVIVNYTGHLTTGLKFDSSLNPGRSPFEFNAGQAGVIEGWQIGLLNMRVGETRILIIPSDLAYGPNGQGNIPGNATLIFEVQLLGIDGPNVVVKGDGHAITAGDTTPDTTDQTDFGDIGTKGFINHFFTLDQSGPGTLSSLPGIRVISLEGADADQFRVQQPRDNNGTTQFGVRFQPTKTGVSTAVVVVRTNDPQTPEFRFTVRGNVGDPTPPVDLSALFDFSFALPTQVGAGDEVPIPVQVTNWGWATADGQVKITIRASSDATLDTNDPIIGTLIVDVNLIKHASTVLTVPAVIPLPGTLPAGNYTVFGRLDPFTGEQQTVDNDIFDSLGGPVTLKVVATKSDLTASIGTVSPTRPVYIPGDVIKVPVKITNTGIRAATAPFTVKVSTSADNVFNNNDTEVTTYTVTEDLAPGASTTQMISYTVPSTGVPADFFFVASADFGTAVDELNEGNNTAASAKIEAGLEFGFVGFTGQGARTLKFFDTDGTLITASITRSGFGAITKDADGYHITISGTNQKSIVTFNATKTSTPGDDGRFTVDTLTIGTSGLVSIKTLNASEMDMTGDLKISGVADSILLGNFTGDVGADDVLTIGTPGFFSRTPLTLNLVMGDVSNVSLTSGIGIRSLNVGRWRDTNATVDKVTAPYLESLKVTGSTVGTIFAGDFAASMTLNATHGKTNRAPTLTNANIAGSITAGTWTLSGKAQSIVIKGNTTDFNIAGTSIGTLNVAGNVTGGKITLSQGVGGPAALASYIVGGTVTDSALYSAGNVSSLRFGTVINSEFFAGVKSTITILPVISSDFTSVVASVLPRIGSIVITGLANAPTAAVLSNSAFAAGRIGSATLPNRIGTVEDGTAVAPYGFATRIGNVGTYVGPGAGTLYVPGNFSNIPN